VVNRDLATRKIARVGRWLADAEARLQGIDAIGFDPRVAQQYCHLENLCNLHESPAPYHSFIVSVLPEKWRGASAAPVRAVAIIDEPGD
jgi:kynurenine formamidase